MKQETKAILALLIHEVQNCENMDEIHTLLDSWVKANDLHLEQVKTFATLEEVREWLTTEKQRRRPENLR